MSTVLIILISSVYIQNRNPYFIELYSENCYLYSPSSREHLSFLIDSAPFTFPISLNNMNEIETEDFNLCVDFIAGFPPGDIDQNKIGNTDLINITGWVIDEVRHCDPHNLLIKIGDTYSPATMLESWDIDNVFDGNGCYANSRFSVSVSTDALRQNGWSFSYYIINNDRTGYYVYDFVIPSIEVT